MRIKQLLSIAVLFVLFTSYFPSKTLATSWSYSIGFCDDYNVDGYKILRIKDLTDVRYNATDHFFEEILIKEGLVVDEQQLVVNKLDHWIDTFFELKTIDKNIIIELEDYDGDGLSFFIGKIIKVDNDSIYFHNFNSIGEWDEEPVKIFYKDISLVSIDDRYSRIISKYVK
jgi:hypothetical protein